MRLRLPPPDEDDEIDITPMIDIIFQLVLFFMVTSSFIDEAKVYKITLPRADEATTIQRESADSVTVTLDGRYFFRDSAGENQVADLDALLQKLRERDPAARKRPMILRCDARCEYRQFVQLKNVLKLAGVETIFEEVEVRRDKGQP